MSEHAISLRGVVKRYGRGAAAASAVSGLDLEVLPGEFTSLMGPSGSGKSTILNLIAGLTMPDEGTVLVNGADLSKLADHELAALRLRTIGFVFQGFNLLPALNVERNVSCPLQFRGLRAAETRRKTCEALERVGLAGYEARHPSELSGGEQQRVAIARAIAGGPSILLADEPTGNLDSRTGESILDLVRSLSREDGTTVIMVTHSTLAAAFGDRTLELRDGRIVRDVRVPAEPSKVVAIKDKR